jgi:hypothetical protein
MKVVCTKIFDTFYSTKVDPLTLVTGKIYDFGYEDGAPVLYNKDGSFGRLANFQIEFFTPLSQIREEKINKILND